MCCNAVTGSAPSYLSELLHLYSPSRSLRSSSDIRMLKIQRFNRKTHGFRTFSHFGPHIWNNLPLDIRHSLLLQKPTRHFSSQNISVKPHCLSLLSVCVCVCVCVCVYLLKNYAWTLVDIYIFIFLYNIFHLDVHYVCVGERGGELREAGWKHGWRVTSQRLL